MKRRVTRAALMAALLLVLSLGWALAGQASNPKAKTIWPLNGGNTSWVTDTSGGYWVSGQPLCWMPDASSRYTEYQAVRPFCSRPLVQIEQGGDSFFYLDSAGNVYQHDEATGLGGLPPTYKKPTRVNGLAGIRQIAAWSHSAWALDSQGQVWVWGRHRLVRGGSEPLPLTRIPMSSRVVSIAACGQTLYMVDSQGDVWSSTNGYYDEDWTPKKCHNLSGIRSVSAQRGISDWGGAVAFIGKDGSLWVSESQQNGYPDYPRSYSYVPGIQAVTVLSASTVHALDAKGNLYITNPSPYDWNQLINYDIPAQGSMRLVKYSPVTSFATSNTCVQLIDQEGTVWGVGGNASGVLGVGKQPTDPWKVVRATRFGQGVPLTSFWVNNLPGEMYVGQTVTPSVSAAPANAEDTGYTVHSSDRSVIRIDPQTRALEAFQAGTATVTFESNLGGFTVKKTIRVKPEPDELTLAPALLTLNQAQTKQLTVTSQPAGSYLQGLVWMSSAPEVASVDQRGRVTGRRSGSATITARYPRTGARGLMRVTVFSPAERIELSHRSLKLSMHSEKVITTAIQAPQNVMATTVSYQSSNPKVATVDAKGRVRAVGVGRATVTASAHPGRATASCTVTVTPFAQDVRLSATKKRMYVGERYQLTATALPQDGSHTTIRFVSSAPQVAKVDEAGWVVPLKAGKVTISAVLPNGKRQGLALTVKERKVKSVRLSHRSLTVSVGFSARLSASVRPANASFKTITWKSSNPAVASVDQTGRVTAKKLGKATITATSVGGKKSRCKLTVGPNELRRSRPLSGRRNYVNFSAKRIYFSGDALVVEVFIYNRTRYRLTYGANVELVLWDRQTGEQWVVDEWFDIDLRRRPLRSGKYTSRTYRLRRAPFQGRNLRNMEASFDGEWYARRSAASKETIKAESPARPTTASSPAVHLPSLMAMPSREERWQEP